MRLPGIIKDYCHESGYIMHIKYPMNISKGLHRISNNYNNHKKLYKNFIKVLQNIYK